MTFRRTVRIAVVAAGCMALTMALIPQALGRDQGAAVRDVSATTAEQDFNGDFFADLAVGVPFEDVGEVTDAGAVNVLYGSATGLTDAGNQFWTQNSTGIADTAEASDGFGFALAAGDFDADGFADLAVGTSGENLIGGRDAGAVDVLYGSAAGLGSARNQFWTQDSMGVVDSAEVADFFGSSLASGDFNADSFADLAVGVPNENLGSIQDCGGVHVLYGSATGLTATGNRLWTQNSNDIVDQAEPFDFLSYPSVATGDVNGDGFHDLAVGVPFEDVNSMADAGAVTVIYGSVDGLAAPGNQWWTQDSMSILDAAEEGDLFGYDLTSANFGKGNHPDLAVGVPGEDVGTVLGAGAVSVIYGSVGGLAGNGNQLWHQTSPGIEGVATEGEGFGHAVAAGDFGVYAQADLAVGVARDNVGGVAEAGSVNVIYGAGNGLRSSGNQLWTQDSTDILDASEVGDHLGWDVWVADYGNGPEADLVASVALEDLARRDDVGAVIAIYGSVGGLQSTGNQYWTQNVLTIGDVAETADMFGSVVG